MKHVHTVGILTAAILLGSACSIKENRTPCPCQLDILMMDNPQAIKELTLSAWNSGQVFVKAIPVNAGGKYRGEVPRGLVRLTALSGVRLADMAEGKVVLSKGSACDSLWTYTAEIDCRGEDAVAEVILRQEFATVHLSIEKEADDGDYPYQLVLKSSVNGVELPSCKPNDGLWSRHLLSGDDGNYLFRVPRQKDGSLSLDLILDGKKVDTYPVGEHIIKAGYDWTKDRLDDIYIGMDWGRSETLIHIEPWDNGEEYEAVL